MRRRKRAIKSFKSGLIESGYLFDGIKESENLIKLWAVRFLVDMRFLNYLYHKEFYQLETFLEYFGIKIDEDTSLEEIDEFLKSLKEHLQKTKLIFPKNLQKNIRSLSNLIGFSQNEQKVLSFLVLAKENEMLNVILRSVDINLSQAKRVVSTLLGINYNVVKNIFSSNSKLFSTGIIKFNYRFSNGSFENLFDFLFDASKLLYSENENILEIFKEYFKKCEESSLDLDSYSHMKEIVDMIINTIKKRVEEKRGANILIYGRAGLGKTELAKLVAKELKLNLFEISYLNEEGEAISGKGRLNALNSAVNILDHKSMIMFDEFEDIADSGFIPFFEPSFEYKSWLNRFLEHTKVPIFWISNKITFLDESMIRRFDLVLEMPDISTKRKIKIADRYLKGLIDDKYIKIIASKKDISPAVIKTLSKVLKDSKVKDEKMAIRLLNETLKAQGYSEIEVKAEKKEIGYNLRYINSDVDIEELSKRLKKLKSARICIYGIPGTGKSEFAKFLSDFLDMPLIKKRGSDLLSMWVGGTEKNIKEAFLEAKSEGAILLIDEADSFLADRSFAQRNWEVTQVNEMLTQMESFEGIFIATTNLIDTLDRASLRRFDIKMEFKALNQKQIEEVFIDICKTLNIKIDRAYLKEALKLSTVTMGDFNTILRQNRFYPIKDSGDLYRRLLEEIKHKTKESVVGF